MREKILTPPLCFVLDEPKVIDTSGNNTRELLLRNELLAIF